MPTASSLDLSDYTGRWIAIVQRRVVATGLSAHETLLNCRAMRLKDEPILRFIPIPSESKHKGQKLNEPA